MPLVRALVSVQLPLEEASPPKGLAWELPAVREELREQSALWGAGEAGGVVAGGV